MKNQKNELDKYQRFRNRIDIYNSKGWDYEVSTPKEAVKLKEWWESFFPECNKDTIVKNKGVEVFHVLRDEKDLGNILKYGLKTRNQLVKEGRLKTEDLGCVDEMTVGPYKNDITYFKYPINEIQRNLEGGEWVSILVYPDKAIVHNSELRCINQEDYFQSMMTLTDYIKRLKELEIKRKEFPDKRFIPNPFTAKPTIAWFDSKDPAGYLYNVGYNCNEIGIPRTIKSSEFYRTSKHVEERR